ncbi:MAG: TIM44-like domain-containing protein [Candidatus Riflebacteria bacterium]|nr:TIM44-like domain-containing protein [Candidatus Riflebacteria bacterium]
MRLTKQQFFMVLAFIFVIAGLVAWMLGALSEKNSDIDIVFLIIYGFTLGIFLRLELWQFAIFFGYAGSLFFCFFYFFVAPFQAPVVLTLFLWPAVMFQRGRLGCGALGTIIVGSAILCGIVLKRPAVAFLLLPTCQLVAMRMTSRVQTRYSRTDAELGPILSQTQREREGLVGKNAKEDWWDVLQLELETIPARVIVSWEQFMGIVPRNDPDEERGPDPNLIRLQDAKLMSRALTDLCRRDRKFATDNFIKRTEEVFWKIQNAWYGQKLEPIQHLVGDALYEQFRQQIDDQKDSGIRYEKRKMSIFETRIVQVNSDPNFDIIHVFLRASSADALTDLKAGKIIAEEEEVRQFSEYWSFLRRPSAQTLEKPGLLEGACPNCSAPLAISQATVCGACRSFIRSGSHDWVLAKITQACEWEYTEASWLPGWDDMIRCDPKFTMQQIEDRGGVIFWMLRLAERQQKIEPLRRFATTDWCAMNSFLPGISTRGWTFMEHVALGSVSLRGFCLDPDWDRLYLLIVWRGVPLTVDAKGTVVRGKRTLRVVREVFVLARRHGIATDEHVTLSSAHCPRCGAPLVSAYSVSCEYCDLILNEGNVGWILERIIDEADPEFQKLQQTVRHAPQNDDESNERRSAIDVLTVMAQVLLADGKIDDREMKLLREMGKKYAVSSGRLDSIIAELKEGIVHIPYVSNRAFAWSLLEAAACMALSDNELSPEEEQTLIRLAQHLGYSNVDVQRALRIAKTRLDRSNTRPK